MAATTVNISGTYATAKDQDLTYATATANDKVIAYIYDGSSVILSKATVNYGGAATQIAISASTKYTLKLTAADMAKIPSGATYIAYLVDSDEETMEEIFNGTFTVASATITAPTPTPSHTIFSVRQDGITDNADTDFTFPAGTILLGVMLYAGGGTPLIDIKDASDAVVVNDAQTVDSDWVYFPSNAFLYSGVTGKLSLESADWESADVSAIFFYTTVEV